MTDAKRKKIEDMRKAGCGYSAIATVVGMTKDGVKSYCRKHNLAGVRSDNNSAVVTGRCLFCGAEVIQHPKRKKKKFCSDSCRMRWWNSHPELVNRKTLHTLVCCYCGQEFSSKNPKQKYCTRLCYAQTRKEAQNG